jgi:hypothetical protein
VVACKRKCNSQQGNEREAIKARKEWRESRMYYMRARG